MQSQGFLLNCRCAEVDAAFSWLTQVQCSSERYGLLWLGQEAARGRCNGSRRGRPFLSHRPLATVKSDQLLLHVRWEVQVEDGKSLARQAADFAEYL